MQLANCGMPLQWFGLYRKDYDLAVPASMSHPAKASWDLAFRIIEHLKELGLLQENSTILDPMAGTGRFNIAACSRGFKGIAVELEAKFVSMMAENKTYAEKKMGKPLDWKIIQGDSRHLSQLLQERGLVSVVSPPYAHPMQFDGARKRERIRSGETLGKRDDVYFSEGNKAWQGLEQGYGDAPGQIASLPDRPLISITSPPYEDSVNPHGEGPAGGRPEDDRSHEPAAQSIGKGYGQSIGQIGQEQGETYLSAMRQVYSEIAKVAHVLVIVTKNPTRNGKLRRLDLDTVSLLEATGWRILCHHHAILFEEQETKDLFGNNHKKVKGRMSFFKRLSWQKGNPVARWEDVIFAVREGEGLVSVMSPPFADTEARDRSKESSGIRDTYKRGDKNISQGYGSTPGQIGKLK